MPRCLLSALTPLWGCALPNPKKSGASRSYSNLPLSVAELTPLCRLVVFPTQLLGLKPPRKYALQSIPSL